MPWSEVLIAALTFFILALYHIYLIYQIRRRPMNTAVGITNFAREQWVAAVMKDKRDILAVQTLRNIIQAATFLASTAILISLGLLGAAFRPGAYNDISHALNLAGTHSETLWMFKLLILAVLFFSAFFNFTLSIRYCNHAGFMINIPCGQRPYTTCEAVADVLNYGALHYTIGMRAYYLSVPMVLWLFGPAWMLAGALILVALLYRLDRTA